nr:GFA family protein [Paraburkholderia sp. RAU2J]
MRLIRLRWTGIACSRWLSVEGRWSWVCARHQSSPLKRVRRFSSHGNAYRRDIKKWRPIFPPGLPVVVGRAADFSFKGEIEPYTTIGGSGMPTTRNFCAHCGSLLFGTPRHAPEIVTIYAGTLDDPSRFKALSAGGPIILQAVLCAVSFIRCHAMLNE